MASTGCVLHSTSSAPLPSLPLYCALNGCTSQQPSRWCCWQQARGSGHKCLCKACQHTRRLKPTTAGPTPFMACAQLINDTDAATKMSTVIQHIALRLPCSTCSALNSSRPAAHTLCWQGKTVQTNDCLFARLQSQSLCQQQQHCRLAAPCLAGCAAAAHLAGRAAAQQA